MDKLSVGLVTVAFGTRVAAPRENMPLNNDSLPEHVGKAKTQWPYSYFLEKIRAKTIISPFLMVLEAGAGEGNRVANQFPLLFTSPHLPARYKKWPFSTMQRNAPKCRIFAH